MVLRAHRGGVVAEDVADLRAWVSALPTPVPVHETVVLGCPAHGDTVPTWAYVEADRDAGVARRRCLACAQSTYVLDSEDRWTFPTMWSCPGCSHSIAEVAAGLHQPTPDTVAWVVLAARCVECGRVEGLTDLVLQDRPVAEVLSAL
jgi:hypothetical protein